MFSLVIAVVSIALIAGVTAMSLSYIPVDAQMRQWMQTEARTGIQALDGAVTRYLNANRGTGGVIQYPGDGVNLVAAVTPAYGFMPADVRKELTWDIATGQVSSMPAVGICLKPIASSTAVQREVLVNLQRQLPVGSTFVSTGCYATANTSNGGYLTYWIPLSHVN